MTDWLKNWIEGASAALETASTAMEDLAPCLSCDVHPVPTEIFLCSRQDDENDDYWNDAWCKAEESTATTTVMTTAKDDDDVRRLGK